jgi:hypothetical protein
MIINTIKKIKIKFEIGLRLKVFIPGIVIRTSEKQFYILGCFYASLCFHI